MGITLRPTRASVTGKRFGPSASSSPASRLLRTPSKLLSLNSIFLFLACVAAAVIARDVVHIFAQDSPPPSDPVPIDTDKGQLPPRNPVAVGIHEPSSQHVQHLVDHGVSFGDASGLEVGAEGYNERYKQGQVKPVDLPPPGAPVAVEMWMDGKRVHDVPVVEKAGDLQGGDDNTMSGKKDMADDEEDSDLLGKPIAGLSTKGDGGEEEDKEERISQHAVEVRAEGAGDRAETALVGGMGAADDGASFAREDHPGGDGGKPVEVGSIVDDQVGAVGLEHDLLNGLPDHAVGDGLTPQSEKNEIGAEDQAADAVVRAEVERNLSALDRNIDSNDQDAENDETESAGAHVAVIDAAGEDVDGREEGEEGGEHLSAKDEGGDDGALSDDGALGNDGDADQDLEWDLPLQPVKDPKFDITMNNLEEVFGIKPMNMTTISKDMQLLLSSHDIRDDAEYQELQTAENMTEFVEKYRPLAYRGSGSILGGDQPGVFADNLYVVRHSGDSRKGYGVYATAMIPSDTILAEYGGELADLDYIESGQYAWEMPEMMLRSPENGSSVNISLVIDAKKVGNLMRFVNDLGEDYHNVEPYWVPVDNFWHLFYVTSKDIQAGEELSVSYGDSYWGESPPESHTKETSPVDDTDDAGQFGADNMEADKFETDDGEFAQVEDDVHIQNQPLDLAHDSEDRTEFSELVKAAESENEDSIADLDAHEHNNHDSPGGEEENPGVPDDQKEIATRKGLRKVILRKHYLSPEDIAARKSLASRNIPTGSLSVPEQVMT